MTRNPEQLSLFDDDANVGRRPRDAEDGTKQQLLDPATCLARRIQDRCDVPIHLTITDNRKNMISKKRDKHSVCRVRLHHMFLDADDRIVEALADYISGQGDPVNVLRTHIRDQRHLIKATPPRPPRQKILWPVGRKHDLREVHESVNKQYFGGASTAAVTWGERRIRAKTRRISFASYNEKQSLITVSRRLNGKKVPLYVLEFLMYHEILHELLGMSRGPTGRRRIHTAEFRRREREFPQYEEAIKFMDEVASGPGYIS